VLLELESGVWETVWATRKRIAHLQFSPLEEDTIMFCDSSVPDSAPKQRIWVMQCRGLSPVAENYGGPRNPYVQQPGEWVTHESWLPVPGAAPSRADILYCYWPLGLKAISPEGKRDRYLARLNFWHAASNRAGTFVVGDTNWPDRGIQLVQVSSGMIRKVCDSNSSDSLREAHPHPSFTPDSRWVIFSSSMSGQSQVYAARLPSEWLAGTLWRAGTSAR